MPPTNYSAIHIKHTNKKQKLSAAQKKFNDFIKKIEKEKKCLQAWQDLIPTYERRLTKEYYPLQQTLASVQEEMVLRLDQFYSRKSFTRTQKDKISHTISELCSLLINEGHDPRLKAIYEKHSGIDFEDEKNAQHDLVRSLFEDNLDIDLGDDFDVTDPDKAAAYIRQKLKEKETQTEKTESKQTAKDKREEAKQEIEQKNISQSIKSVYRQLIAAYHPDRETDPDERDRKTEIMQRVNTAYKNKDLLQLLELQLELEQIDQKHINTIAEDRLQAYNKVLKNQLEQLQQEISQIEVPFRMSANIPPFESIVPDELMCLFDDDMKKLQAVIKQINGELEFLTSVKNFKIWLKDLNTEEEEEALMDDFFSNMFNSRDF